MHTNNEDEMRYLEKVRMADKRAREILQEHPHLDYSDLLHSLLALNLSPEERLARCLARNVQNRP